MCGIVGLWGPDNDKCELVRNMAGRIAHRGPDSDGVWVDKASGVALAHRRLAVVELSSAGAQPMISHNERFVISFNGEIYNHLDLRREMDATSSILWRGGSDTETLLEGISTWGLDGTLQRTNGMFAFALWDRRTKKLFLARDRIGEKPLYWGRLGGDFVFASELKAMFVHPRWTGAVDRNVLALFLRNGYVPAPHTIHPGLFKLEPGHWLEISDNGRGVGKPVAYWSIEDVARKGTDSPFVGTTADAISAVERLISDAVEQRMLADVPLGALLSGGYDSSLIVAFMQTRSLHPVHTFSIGFNDASVNEAQHANDVARYLGTDHTELYVGDQDAVDCVPLLSSIWDEPFADSSQIPTLLVSRLARQTVTVALSGDGGDELFYGYNRYRIAQSFWGSIGYLPAFARRGLGLAFRGVGVPIADLLPGGGDRLLRTSGLLESAGREEFYRALLSHFFNPADIVLGATKEADSLFSESASWPRLLDFREQMMFVDQKTYLPDDILTKVDRASMAVALEMRVPLLDHKVVEFAWSLPMSFKLRDRQPKWLLRQLTHRHVPKELMERPKTGFRVPLRSWLRGVLRPWAEALLDEHQLREQGFFDPRAVREMWTDLLSGRRRNHTQLWNILMFQAWYVGRDAASSAGRGRR
jgi:asparagine synthase (glutamine-hydrolysing)